MSRSDTEDLHIVSYRNLFEPSSAACRTYNGLKPGWYYTGYTSFCFNVVSPPGEHRHSSCLCLWHQLTELRNNPRRLVWSPGVDGHVATR